MVIINIIIIVVNIVFHALLNTLQQLNNSCSITCRGGPSIGLVEGGGGGRMRTMFDFQKILGKENMKGKNEEK